MSQHLSATEANERASGDKLEGYTIAISEQLLLLSHALVEAEQALALGDYANVLKRLEAMRLTLGERMHLTARAVAAMGADPAEVLHAVDVAYVTPPQNDYLPPFVPVDWPDMDAVRQAARPDDADDAEDEAFAAWEAECQRHSAAMSGEVRRRLECWREFTHEAKAQPTAQQQHREKEWAANS